MTPQAAIAIQGLLLDAVEDHVQDKAITDTERLGLIRLALLRYREKYEPGVAEALARVDAPSSATVTRSDAPQSSVQIETMAKGLPKLTIKVYGEGAQDARDLAVSLYEETLAHFANAAKVTESEATT